MNTQKTFQNDFSGVVASYPKNDCPFSRSKPGAFFSSLTFLGLGLAGLETVNCEARLFKVFLGGLGGGKASMKWE